MKNLNEKVKMDFSGMEKFARKHTNEMLTVIAIIIGTLSAWGRFFVGGIGLVLIFMAAGAVIAIFFPSHVDHWMKKIYLLFNKGDKISSIIGEGIRIAVALFVPFIYFGFLGLLAGCSYHYYTRYSESGNPKDLNKPPS